MHKVFITKILNKALGILLPFYLIVKKLFKKKEIPGDLSTSKENFDYRGARGIFSFRPISNGSRARKEDFVIRFGAFLIAALLIIIILLITYITISSPLRQIIPMFLSVKGKDEQIYRVEPLEKTTKAFRVVTKSIIYQYVESRESIDFQTDEERYQFVQWLSSPEVFSEFYKEFGKENKAEDAPRQRAETYNLARGVKIIGIDFLKDYLLQVDFELWEYNRTTGERVTKADMRATITIVYEPKKVLAKDEYMNPLGLKVIDYSLETRNLKEFVILKNYKTKFKQGIRQQDD